MIQKPKYLYAILDKPVSPSLSIKTIMFDKKLISGDGEIWFYYPYNVLCAAYSQISPNYGMWGIGFLFDALKEKGIWDGKLQKPQNNTG